MLRYDVNSLEQLEEIEHLEAEAATEKASNNLPDCIPYDFLADVDSLFNLQTLAYLGALTASQGSGNRISPVPPSS